MADSSVQAPLLAKPGTPSDIRMQVDFELPEDENYSWEDMEDYKMDQFQLDSEKERNLEDIPKINAILYFFEKKILNEGKKHSEVDDLKDYANLESIYKKALINELNWTAEDGNQMQSIIGLSKLGIAKLSHPCDKEYVRTNLIQTLYPIDLIWKLNQVINRDFGKPHYDKALRIQNTLSEIFLHHHLRSDTRFHNKIATENLNLTDPLMRIKIREMNRNDPLIKRKYLGENFDLKKFILTMFELYFPNVTWRYIGGDQEMHRWSLEILLYSFELGIWESSELSDLLNSLYLRIENLVVLEKRSYLDFTTTLTGYPKFVSNMKKYFKICNNLVISTCLHIVMLMNDESFKHRFPLYNSSLDYDTISDNSENWKAAYFNNHDISNILHKILTKYLLNKDHNIKIDDESANAVAERAIENKKFKYISDFLLFITDHENDLYFTSSNNATPEMVEYYTKKHIQQQSPEEILADRYRTKFLTHLDSFASCFKPDSSRKLGEPLYADLVEFIGTLTQRATQTTELLQLKYSYAFRGVPKILMSMLSLIIHFEDTKKLELICKVALVELLKSNQIGQAMIFDEVGLFHFNNGYRNKRSLEAVLFLDEVFHDNYHIFYNHRYLCREFLEIYDKVRKGHQLLEYVFTPEGRKQLRAKGEAGVAIEKKWTEEVLSSYKALTDPEQGEEAKKQGISSITSLFIFYSYSRWVSNLFETTNPSFQSKYYDLMIQDKLATPFFEVLMPIILDKDFLPRTGDGSVYAFKSQLQNGDPFIISTLSEKVKEGLLTEGDIRGIIFEIAMMTAHLVNKLCKRFYTQAIYEFRFLKYARKILPDTEYLLDMEGGLGYRTIMLEMYNIFAIFPNNHLVGGRKEHFAHEDKKSECLVPTKDDYIVKVHEEIKKEIELLASFEGKKSKSPVSFDENAKKYFFHGLFPVMYKFCSGIYHLYTVNPDLKKELERMKSLVELLKSTQSLLLPFGIKLNMDNVESREEGGLLGGLGAMLNTNQVAPTGSNTPAGTGDRNPPRKRLRPKSFIEKSSAQLVELRNLLEDLISVLRNSYHDDEKEETYEYFSDLQARFYRRDVLSDPTKFDKAVDAEKVQVDDKSKRTMVARFSKVIDDMGLKSPQHGYFKWLMNDYIKKKKEAIHKVGDQNIFVDFLDSNEGSAKSIIDFFINLSTQWWRVQKAAENQDQADADNPEGTIPDAVQMSDNVAVISLQEFHVLSFVEFLDRVMNDSKHMKKSLYEAITTGDEAAKGKSFLSLLFFIMMRFFSITAFKPFMDSDWRIIKNWTGIFLSFFKNLCENNYTPFKTLLGEMKPNVEGTKLTLNRSLFFEVFVYIESTLANTKVINTYQQLVLEERAELYPIFMGVLRFLSECCCGPCKENQEAIFRFRTDMFANLIRRVVDDIESSHYQMKDCTLDYILSLTEGNESTIKYFGNNFTYEELLTTLYKLLKRLYIYSVYSKDKSSFAKLVKQAKLKYEKDFSENQKLKQSLRLLPEVSEKFYNIQSHKQSVESDVEFDMYRPEVICDAVADYITVHDYKDIYETYIQSKTFSEHHIMSAVLKITELIIKFAELNDSFKIYLDNTYRILIDKYGEDVPVRVRNRFPKYERQEIEQSQFPEKYHFFMFITKVTSTLNVLNPKGEAVEITYPLKPCVFFLTEATRDEFMQVVDLDQPTYDLVRDYHKFQIEMEDNLELHRNYPMFYKLSSDDSFTNIKKSVWSIGLALNVLLLIFYTRDSVQVNTPSGGNLAIIITGAVNSGISFIFLVIWFMSKYAQKAAIAKQQYEIRDPLVSRFDKFTNYFEIYFYYSVLQQNYPVFFLWHVWTNILGIFVSPFFYTLQLLSIIFISKTTRYVVQSITTHFDQLSLTFMLSVFVMYSYSVLSAESFFTTLAGVDTTAGTYTYCTTLWDCLIYHVDFGLRNGGGIADSSSTNFTPFEPSSNRFVSKFFYNIIFFILINVISLNIIFGIIIDTFANMRDENTTRSKLFDNPSRVTGEQMFGLPKEQARDPAGGGQDFQRSHHIRARLLELLQLPDLPEPEAPRGYEWFGGTHPRKDRRNLEFLDSFDERGVGGRSEQKESGGDAEGALREDRRDKGEQRGSAEDSEGAGGKDDEAAGRSGKDRGGDGRGEQDGAGEHKGEVGVDPAVAEPERGGEGEVRKRAGSYI